jgi:transposase InsO family protein
MRDRYGTTSWHNTAKSSGLPVEANAVVAQGSITFLPGETCRERSGQEAAEAIVVGETSRSADEHRKIAGSLTQRRAELHRSVLTARRTVNPPMTPDGEVEPRAVTMGSMWAFRSGLRPASYAGLSRVSAEPPCTDPYARWCGTRGWLAESVTGIRFCFLDSVGRFGVGCIGNLHS